jgi:cytochrome c-type biogenesis protein CcmH/NrfG
MKPKIICTQCNASLALNAQFCPSCGAAIEWPGGGSSTERSAGPDRTGSTKKDSRKQFAWTPLVIAAGAVVVFLVAIMTDQRSSSVGVGTAAQPPMAQMAPDGNASQGADMHVLQEIEALESRVKADPSDMPSVLALANMLHDGRFYDRAVVTYQIYLKKRPTDANARVDMGVCMHESGRSKDGVTEIKRALKDDPRHIKAHFNLGIITLSMGDVKESNSWFKKTVELDPQSDVGQRAQQLLSQHNPQQLK